MPQTILVVDDEDSIRLLMQRLLIRSGYSVATARDGQEAIDHLSMNEVDAMILDLMMPKVDGFGVLNYLISHQPLLVQKTVVVTAFPSAAAEFRLKDVCLVLSKPFEVQHLLSAVENCFAA